jgi:hypothetical protein
MQLPARMHAAAGAHQVLPQLALGVAGGGQRLVLALQQAAQVLDGVVLGVQLALQVLSAQAVGLCHGAGVGVGGVQHGSQLHQLGRLGVDGRGQRLDLLLQVLALADLRRGDSQVAGRR